MFWSTILGITRKDGMPARSSTSNPICIDKKAILFSFKICDDLFTDKIIKSHEN